jgi:hypothetical protein
VTTSRVRQRRILRDHLLYGGKGAAARLGVSYSHLKNTLHDYYRDLGVSSDAQAAIAEGWLRLPDDDEIAAVDALQAATRDLEQAASSVEAVLGQLRSAGPASGGVRVPVRDPATTRPGAPECRCTFPERMGNAHRLDCPRAA